MNPVVQLGRTGCAIASVAARMGMSYPDMKSLARSLGVTPEDNALWTSTSSIKWKIHDGIRPVTGSCLSERTRVRLSWIRKKLRTNVRRDFGRMHPSIHGESVFPVLGR